MGDVGEIAKTNSHTVWEQVVSCSCAAQSMGCDSSRMGINTAAELLPEGSKGGGTGGPGKYFWFSRSTL